MHDYKIEYIYMIVLWFKFFYGLKIFELVLFLFSFVSDMIIKFSNQKKKLNIIMTLTLRPLAPF